MIKFRILSINKKFIKIIRLNIRNFFFSSLSHLKLFYNILAIRIFARIDFKHCYIVEDSSFIIVHSIWAELKLISSLFQVKHNNLSVHHVIVWDIAFNHKVVDFNLEHWVVKRLWLSCSPWKLQFKAAFHAIVYNLLYTRVRIRWKLNHSGNASMCIVILSFSDLYLWLWQPSGQIIGAEIRLSPQTTFGTASILFKISVENNIIVHIFLVLLQNKWYVVNNWAMTVGIDWPKRTELNYIGSLKSFNDNILSMRKLIQTKNIFYISTIKLDNKKSLANIVVWLRNNRREVKWQLIKFISKTSNWLSNACILCWWSKMYSYSTRISLKQWIKLR